MSQVAKQCIRMGTIVLGAALLFALLLVLRSKSPSQAAHLEPIASSSNISNCILPENGAYHGVVIHLEQIDDFEDIVDKKLAVVKVYQHFHNTGFYTDWAKIISDHGAIEFLSLDPTISETIAVTCGQTEAVSRTLHPDEVMSGAYDEIITQFARQIRDWGRPLILSFAGEMNGCYCELVNWQGCRNEPNGPEKYIQMYQYVYNKFKGEGANNVLWAWVVNHEPLPIDNYYPGDDYVDIISVDGYNWGNNGPGGWKTFNQVFSATLTSLSNTHPMKPLMLGEFASVEGTNPMSKANWTTDAYSRTKSHWPQIKAVLWFNFPGDWSFPVESSPESVQAYREAIADPYFIGDPVWCRNYLPLVFKSYKPTTLFCTNSGKGGTETITVEPPRIIGGIHIDLFKRALPSYGFSLWEVEIYDSGTSNLAIGATATASSSQDSPGCYECFPEKAIDGNMNTRWGSDFDEPQWLEITLPAPHAVNRIVLKWENAYAEEYCVTVIE